MATTRIKDLSKTATTVNSDANLVLDGNTGGTQKITRDNFRQDTADAFVAAPGTYNLAPLNSGTGKIDATYLPTSSDTPKGAWDASTNTPTLADGSGTAGDYYDVTVAGSSDLGSGSITFTVGDVVKYNGTVWFKIDSVSNILDGVSTIDGAKAAIEIPDVGSSPNEVSLNGMLGSMAFQSAEAVSVAQLQGENAGLNASPTDARLTITDSTNDCIHLTADESTLQGPYADTQIRMGGNIVVKGVNNAFLTTGSNTGLAVDSTGRVGIGTASPGSYNSGANNLVVGSGSGAEGISIITGTASKGSIYFGDGTGASAYRGQVQYDHNTNQLEFATQSAIRWYISSSGDLTANGAHGIDFGSAATSAGQGTNTTGSVSNSVLSDYEFGSWTPSFATSGADFAAITMDVIAAQYVKVGKHVHCQAYIRTDNVDRTGASGTVVVEGLPFVSDTSSGNYATLSVGYSSIWVNAPTAGYVQPNAAYAFLTRNGTTGISVISAASDITDGASSNVNELIFTISYIAST